MDSSILNLKISLFTLYILIFSGGCLEINFVQSDMMTLDPDTLPQTSRDLFILPSADSSREPADFSFSAPNSQSDLSLSSNQDQSLPLTGESFALCVANMKRVIQGVRSQHCQFTVAEQQDLSSPYHRQIVVAACLYLSCDQRVIEGHNGVMIGKTCSDLEDLSAVLERAEVQAKIGECNHPTYQTAWISLDQFQGGETCDQIQCTFGPDTQLGF